MKYKKKEPPYKRGLLPITAKQKSNQATSLQHVHHLQRLCPFQ